MVFCHSNRKVTKTYALDIARLSHGQYKWQLPSNATKSHLLTVYQLKEDRYGGRFTLQSMLLG